MKRNGDFRSNTVEYTVCYTQSELGGKVSERDSGRGGGVFCGKKGGGATKLGGKLSQKNRGRGSTTE